MTIESEDGNEDAPAGEQPRDPHLMRTAKDRDTWKAKAKAHETRLAELEAAEAERATQLEMSKGEWDKLSARQQKALDAERARADKAEAELGARIKGDRRSSFAEAIASTAKVGNVRAVAMLLPSLGLEDDAPESYGKAEIKAATEALRSVAPELFATTTNPSPKPPPGGGIRPNDPNDPDFYRKLAHARSTSGPSSAYSKARGRSG